MVLSTTQQLIKLFSRVSISHKFNKGILLFFIIFTLPILLTIKINAQKNIPFSDEKIDRDENLRWIQQRKADANSSIQRENITHDVEGTLDQRIISTSPTITKIIFDIGAGYQVHGVTELCMIPENEKKRPIIGRVTFNMQKITDISPHKVLGMGKANPLAEQLNKAGLESRFFKHPTSTRGINQLILEVGAAIDELDKAQNVVKTLKEELKEFYKEPQPRFRKTVLLLFYPKPLMGVGTIHPAHEMILMAGGNNVVQTPMPFVNLSDEFLIQSDPDVIILTNPDDQKFIDDHPILAKKVDGTPRKIISDIDPQFFVLPGTNYVDGIKHLRKKLYSF